MPVSLQSGPRSCTLALLLCASAAGCSLTETTVELQPGLTMDADADSDASDVDVQDLSDADQEAPAQVDVCLEVTVGLILCGYTSLSPEQYGNTCGRMSSFARACTLDAPGDFEYTCDCLATLDPYPDCSEICGFVNACIGTSSPTCGILCPWSSGHVMDCARDRMSEGDCHGAISCIVGWGFDHGCADACDMALACDYDVDPAGCEDECEITTSTIDGGIVRSCLDVSVFLGDCEALAACGGLGL